MRLVPSQHSPAEDATPTEVDLVLERIRIRMTLRACWLDHLREQIGDRPLVPLESVALDSPREESAWLESSPRLEAARADLATVERALAEASDRRFERLGASLGLSSPELDLLQLLFAVAIEPRLGGALSSLHPSGRSFPTVGIASRLFGYGRDNILTTDSPLLVWELVHVGEPVAGEQPALACDAFIADWLQGLATTDGQLGRCVRPVAPRPALRGWPAEEVLDTIRRSIERGIPIRAILSGPAGVGRRTLAAQILQQLGSRAFCVDPSAIADADWPRVFMLCQRFAVLQQAGLVWLDSTPRRPWPARIPTTMVQVLTCHEGEQIPRAPDLADHRFELPVPSSDESLELWRSMLPECRSWPTASMARLVASHRLTVGEIAEVARHVPASVEHAEFVVRQHGRGRMGELAQLLPTTTGWDDLVVPDDLRRALRVFAFEASDRAAFWESTPARRLFPRGTGLVGLMTGPPGTGKTMTGQVIARELGLDLYRIDLAGVVSKYIGETAKNLRQIFQRASRLNAVLLFDEADSMFAKRTEVKDSHDRHANADTSYLLQLIEGYRGVALLASNKRGNIDPAFIRRIRYVFSFPRPDAAQRAEIWRRVVSELSPSMAASSGPALDRLGTAAPLSGAEIKNAVLAGVFRARQRGEALSIDDLLRGIDQELAKEGRSMSLDNRRAVMRSA